jgi:carbamoyl-phosphate synthase small subunit
MVEQETQSDLLAVLVLEDGRCFYGRPFGAIDALERGRRGEVVFATSMTGYQEICTDPSYRGQIVALTYPLIGNYGIADTDMESIRPWLSALIVREYSADYSNWRASRSLDAYLKETGIPGLCNLDTRALTRHLRTNGTLRGIIQTYTRDSEPDIALLSAAAQQVYRVTELDVVGEVARRRSGQPQDWIESTADHRGTSGKPEYGDTPTVLLIDTGFKQNIARCLTERGLRVLITPYTTDLAAVQQLSPDGIVLSNGPGDPESVAQLIDLTRNLITLAEPIPLLGICLGHQILGLAAGSSTSRLPFGHHGGNHPVREEATGIVTITSQNHNFQVDALSVPKQSGFYVSHINLSDGSVEGLAHEELPVFSVQYHPEAAPGPQDNRMIFDRFAALARSHFGTQGIARNSVEPTARHSSEEIPSRASS